jgi:hypothetical protein
MILRQFLHTDPAVAASYLFGCGGRAAGAVVADRDAFIAYMLRDTPPRPPNAAHVRAVNLGLQPA